MDLLVLYFLVKILLHALFTIQLAELLEFQCCLAYASLCGLVVGLVDVCENSFYAGFDVLYKFFHDLETNN